MTGRFKYSHHGTGKLYHASEIIATGLGPKELCFYVHESWCGVFLQTRSIDNMVYPVITVTGSARIPPKTPIFLNITSKNPKFKNKFKMETFAEGENPVVGPKVPILDVLNTKNGFLDENGAMSFEYGFHFDGYFDENDEIWKFNLKCTIFYGYLMSSMITYTGKDLFLFSHKVLILFHDTNHKVYSATRNDTLEIPENCQNENFENFLQIVHGVQLKLDAMDLINIICIAHRYGVQNVLKYCERQLLMKFSEFPEDEFLKLFTENPRLSIMLDLMEDAVNFDLNQLLAFLLNHLLKNWKIKNQNFLEKLNLDKMTNVSMKMIVAKVLYGKC
ncbi:unnamed protein product [Caenorhabditis nigoni]|uniref:BTB domain-containing protein n=1 Tax=Caenorhabditis nigoni TaxID=1611254 RepID=A0A2G5SHV1_9PELO|nr:hypothetical protein B9Z55_026805 [Caenorhabditis nigoni]